MMGIANARRHFFKTLTVASFALCASAALADATLLREVETLRNGLSAKDPSRPALTLRLADLYFDSAGELGRNPMPSPEETKVLTRYRTKAALLFQQALNGDGFAAPAAGTLRLKLQFQLARLYSDLDQWDKARPLWVSLVEQKEMPDLRREASLRLAEEAEKQDTKEAAVRADRYYRLAIELCAGGDVCSYAHYRRAWLYRNSGDLPNGLAEMKLALVDSKGQVREEALRDYIVFLASGTTDGQKELLEAEALAGRFNRPTLIKDLSDAFFSAGNRRGGTLALGLVNGKKPSLKNQVRLLEEYYGMRDWDKFRDTLESTRALATEKPVALTAMETAVTPAATETTVASAKQDSDTEVEKILRRLTVQLDGERLSQPKFADDFRDVVQLYLTLYPNNGERWKMVEGWIASEKDPKAKLEQLKLWIDDKVHPLSFDQRTKLRQTRAALALKENNHEIAGEEMGALAAESKDPAKTREYRFHQANASYNRKENDVALPIYRELADFRKLPNQRPDFWAAKSQNLALDILNQKKDYTAIVAQAHTWTESEALKAEAAKPSANAPKLPQPLAKELVDMHAIAQQAEFEGAAAKGKTKEALATFQKFCLAGEMLPKSCENARVLAVELKAQPELFAVLKQQGKQSELASEYEAAGFFADAAKILEPDLSPLKGAPTLGQRLKVALLYELAGKNADRDRVLHRLTASLPAKPQWTTDEESLVFQTLKEAQLLNSHSLTIGWNETHRRRLAELLESKGQASPATKKIVMESKEETGPAWAKYTLEDLRKVDAQQRKIAFYGAKGKKKFEARLKAIKDLDAFAEKKMPGAGSGTRVEIAKLVAQSYDGFAKEIINSPIPAEVTPEESEAVKQSLAQMAAPFEERAKSYEGVAAEQLAKAKEASDRTAAETKTAEAKASEGSPAKVAERESTAKIDAEIAAAATAPSVESPEVVLQRSLSSLHGNPSDPAALAEIKKIYEGQGQGRLAAYFEGRLLQLQKEGGSR